MTISKSPRRVLQVAYDAACQAVPAPRHRFSPRKFTQPQLLACLVLKEFLRLDYRGIVEHLADHGELTRHLALKGIPHYTTLQKAAERLLKAAPGRELFDAVLDLALRAKVRKRRVPLAAVDGTGMETRHTSRYYVKRRSRTGNQAPRPEAEVSGRPPRGGRFRPVAPLGGGHVGKAPSGPSWLFEVELPLSTLQLLLFPDVLPHSGLI